VIALKWPVAAILVICVCLIAYVRPDISASKGVAAAA
jgi:hypothetical protein